MELSEVEQAVCVGLGQLRRHPQSLQSSLELVRQRPKPYRLNRKTRLGVGHCLGGLV